MKNPIRTKENCSFSPFQYACWHNPTNAKILMKDPRVDVSAPIKSKSSVQRSNLLFFLYVERYGCKNLSDLLYLIEDERVPITKNVCTTSLH